MAFTTVLFPWATWPIVPMLIVAWRQIISGDSGLSFEKSIVFGSGCSLLYVSPDVGVLRVWLVLRKFWPFYRWQNLPRLLQGGLGLHFCHLFGLRGTLIVTVIMLRV